MTYISIYTASAALTLVTKVLKLIEQSKRTYVAVSPPRLRPIRRKDHPRKSVRP